MDNGKELLKMIKSAAAIAFSAALLSLLVCCFFLSNRLPEQLAPLLLAVFFSLLGLLFERIPFMQSRKTLKLILHAIFAIAAGILLGI